MTVETSSAVGCLAGFDAARLTDLRRPEKTSKLALGRVPIMRAIAASSLYSAAPASTLSAQQPTQFRMAVRSIT
jgi:hypothetical protein